MKVIAGMYIVHHPPKSSSVQNPDQVVSDFDTGERSKPSEPTLPQL